MNASTAAVPDHPTRIVVIEDEPDIRQVIHVNLAAEGFSVIPVGRGDEGLRKVLEIVPDLVLLDLLLPGLGGIEVCQRLKRDPATREIPVVMVSAKGEETDIVLGLGIGADDYVTKPFSPRELVARVRAVLRRTAKPPAGGGERRISCDGVLIDPVRHEVRVDDQPADLTVTEFRLLHQLASHPGRVFTRDQLIRRVMGHDANVTDRNIDVHVRGIRRKLGHYRHLIVTVRGVGYRFDDRAS